MRTLRTLADGALRRLARALVWRRRRSFTFRFYAALIPVIIAANLAVAVFAAWIGIREAAKVVDANRDRTIESLAYALAKPLHDFQFEHVDKLLQDFPKAESIREILVTDDSGFEVARFAAPDGEPADGHAETAIVHDKANARVPVGALTISYTKHELVETGLWIFSYSLVISAATTLIVFLVTMRLTEARIIRPLQHLARIISDVRRRGARRRIADTFDGEFGAVVNAFNAMQDRLERDEAELKEANARLYRTATTDALTGLLNRSGFEAAARRLLTEAERDGRGCLLMFVDLNRFKAINDAFGHAVGDQVLKRAGRRLAATAPAGSIVARLSGDEFVILALPPETGEERLAGEGASLSQRIVAAIGAEFEIDGHRFRPGASVGYVSSGVDYDYDTLVRRADIAMYEMKKTAAPAPVAYAPSLEERKNERLRIERILIECLEGDLFTTVYQPIVALDTLRPVGAEALLRMSHPDEGELGPATFIPVAEECGLMPRIGMGVFRKAAEAAVAMRQDGAPDGFYFAVNVSALQLSHAFSRFISGTIQEFGLAASDFVLELTENIALTGDYEGEAVLEEIQSRGVRLALDDFGTGYSSLAYIATLNPDIVKIDRSFIRDTSARRRSPDGKRRALLNAMTTLCRDLRLPMVGEGIETEQELLACRRLGVTHGQGYLFSRPLPLPELRTWRAMFSGSTRAEGNRAFG